jgi:hypothetical protein
MLKLKVVVVTILTIITLKSEKDDGSKQKTNAV